MKEFKTKFTDEKELEFAFVGYRDYFNKSGDWDSNLPVKYMDFTNS